MKGMKYSVVVLLLCILFSVAVFAGRPAGIDSSTLSSLSDNQLKTVFGSVVDSNGEPIIGAAIIVVGTTTGTSTDLYGNYSFDVPTQGKIQYYCIGYETVTVAISNRNRIDVVMQDFVPRADNAAALSFIRDMYNNRRFESYSFLQKHCTEDLLEELAEEYGFEGEGYATWKFRSGAQDEKYSQPSANVSKILTIKQVQEDVFEYTALDMGWKFTNTISLSKSGNTFLIEYVDTWYAEFDENY